jgi:hypothetical protein
LRIILLRVVLLLGHYSGTHSSNAKNATIE